VLQDRAFGTAVGAPRQDASGPYHHECHVSDKEPPGRHLKIALAVRRVQVGKPALEELLVVPRARRLAQRGDLDGSRKTPGR
jgi:hypothetical protein